MQVPIMGFMLANRFAGIWASMGSGKTSASLRVLSILKLINPEPALIVAPKYVAQFTWPDEVAKWEGFGNLTVSSAIGSAEQRLAALRKPADIYCINFENLQWLEENLPKGFSFTKCIIDESTKVKGYRRNKGSSRARALYHLTRKAKYLYELTGTPGSNGLLDLWGQLYFLDNGKRLGTSMSAYTDRWFKAEDPYSSFPKLVPTDTAPEEITKAVSDICLSVSAEDYFPLEKIIETNIEVELPPKVMSKYKELHREMMINLGKNEVRAMSQADKTLKCLQIASGAIYTSEDRSTWEILHDAKLDALESVVEEAAGEPLLVAYHWKHDLARIKKRFPKFKIFDGKESTLRAWNRGELAGMLAHPASLGHGINLQDGGRRMVFFSHWWSLEERNQFRERIGPMRQMQSGHKRSVFQYNIIARGTVDERVLLAHKYKLSVDQALREGTKA
jgi:SNF2 family DNA or RNA helicase